MTTQTITTEKGQIIAQAIRHRRLLAFQYDGLHRVVEPHAYGVTRAENEAVRCFQVQGESNSGQATGWKLMLVDGMHDLTVLPESFAGARIGYKANDKALPTLFAQL